MGRSRKPPTCAKTKIATRGPGREIIEHLLIHFDLIHLKAGGGEGRGCITVVCPALLGISNRELKSSKYQNFCGVTTDLPSVSLGAYGVRKNHVNDSCPKFFFSMKTLLVILPYKTDFRSSGNHAHPVAKLDTLLEVTRCTERTGGYAI